MSSFRIRPVSVEMLDGEHAIAVVPPSQWHGDRQERPARAALANLKADNGLRTQVSLVRWDDSDEISLGFAELLAGPSDYERLEDAGAISPRLVDNKLVARMESVRSRVTGDFADKARTWTAVEPRGRELWIDTDGAVGGFIGASPRLLDYLGPDPAGDVARGFFTPRFYFVDGDEVADLDSGERWRTPFAERLTDGVILRVTTYGDVLVVGDADGLERVATVTAAEWFPGHLG